MTTSTLRRDTQSTDAERNHTADMRRAGAVERAELPSLAHATLERIGDLVLAGYYADARAMHRREFETKNEEQRKARR